MGNDGLSFELSLGNISNSVEAVRVTSIYSFVEVVSAYSSIDYVSNGMLTAAVNDIMSDASSLAWFERTAQRTISAACLFNSIYTQDSLVPSTDINSLAAIPCAPGTSVVSACTNFGSTLTCPSGCINMYNVMSAAGSLTAFMGQIATRYAATPSCISDLTSQFTTNYNNWHVPRVDPTNGIASVKSRWNSGLKSTVGGMITDMAALTTNLTQILNNAGSLVPTLASTTVGLLAGLNCTLFGEDIQLIKNAVCSTAFNSIYASFVFISVEAYMLVVILIVFALIRKSDIESTKAFEDTPAANHSDIELKGKDDFTAAQIGHEHMKFEMENPFNDGNHVDVNSHTRHDQYPAVEHQRQPTKQEFDSHKATRDNPDRSK